MFYHELNSLIDNGSIDRDAVIKFDNWLGSLPVGFTGELNPLDFAQNFDVDCVQVASLFNEACMHDILKIDFEQICPECGKCLGSVCSEKCQHRCQCEEAGKKVPRKLRFSYHLNKRYLLPN